MVPFRENSGRSFWTNKGVYDPYSVIMSSGIYRRVPQAIALRQSFV